MEKSGLGLKLHAAFAFRETHTDLGGNPDPQDHKQSLLDIASQDLSRKNHLGLCFLGGVGRTVSKRR